MSYTPVKKGTLLIPSGPDRDPDRRHLFVICTDVCENGNQVIVPISSRMNNLCDGTCVLQVHEHAFLRKESFVFYRKARIESSESLISGVEKNIFTVMEDMNAQTFLRILKGICRSPETARKIKTYLGC